MPIDDVSFPPPDSTRVECWTLTGAGDLRHLRRNLVTVLTDQRIPTHRALDAVPDKVSVVATELAGNALRYGSPPVQVCLYRCDTAFVVDVTDSDLEHPPKITMRPAPGFGLRIAESMAESAGWYIDGRRKHVWAQFVVPHWEAATL